MDPQQGAGNQYKYLKLAAPYILAFIIFFIFKYFVPNPWYSRDSWDYINCAVRGNVMWYRPLGYTTFLKFIHDNGGNYNTAIYFHFIFFLITSFFFLEKFFSLYKFTFSLKVVAWVLTIFNPFIIYLSNFLTTDSLFVSLTSLWLLSLINTLTMNKRQMFVWGIIHFVSYFPMFALRFNGLYYPGIALLAVLLYKAPLAKKAIFAVATVLISLAIVNNVEEHAEKHTGTAVFSGLGSWAIANNAIHIYKVQDVDKDLFDGEHSAIHELVLIKKDSVKFDEGEVTDQYMWSGNGPLKTYIFYKRQLYQGRIAYFTEWFALAPVYREFGMILIKNYPMAFLKSFYLLNLRNAIFPRMEILNFKGEIIPPIDSTARDYIKFRKEGYTYTKTQVWATDAMQKVFSFFNILTLLASLAIIPVFLKRWKEKDMALTTLFLLSMFHLATIFLLAFAHPVWIRYIAFNELFITLIPIAFVLMMAQVRAGKVINK